MHRQHLNHSCLRVGRSSICRTTSILGRPCRTAEPRTTAHTDKSALPGLRPAPPRPYVCRMDADDALPRAPVLP